MIRKAKPEDAAEIVRIVDSVLLHKLDNESSGFLMVNSGKEKYDALVRESSYCYAAVDNGAVVGFLLAYPKALMKPDNEIHEYFLQKYSDNFIYIFQVAVDPDYHRKGIGKDLYNAFFDDAKGIMKCVISSAEPYNKASEKMHLSLGFKKVDKIKTKKGFSFIYEMV